MTSDVVATTDRPLFERLEARRLPAPENRKAIREAAGATLAEIGTELGVSTATAARWERGTVEPRREHAAAYRQLLDQLRLATR